MSDLENKIYLLYLSSPALMRSEMPNSSGRAGGVRVEEVMHQDNRNGVSVTEAMNVMELPGFD